MHTWFGLLLSRGRNKSDRVLDLKIESATWSVWRTSSDRITYAITDAGFVSMSKHCAELLDEVRMESYVLHIVPLIGCESWRNEAINFLRFSLKIQALNLFIKGRQIYLIARIQLVWRQLVMQIHVGYKQRVFVYFIRSVCKYHTVNDTASDWRMLTYRSDKCKYSLTD